MKKLYIIIALVLGSCAQMASAQNMYREYQTGYHPRTAVSVVHSNGYVYFFQADETGCLIAIEIDPLSMLPTGNSKRFDINQTPGCIVYLNGGFEDASGDFVLFGYNLEMNNIYSPSYPTFIKITQNFSFCDVYYEHHNGEYIAGCDGYNQNSEEVYVFMNGREIDVVELVPSIALHRLRLDEIHNPNDFFTDISWDAIHSTFIATGSAWNTQTGHECPFVDVFDLINNDTIHSIAEYFVDNLIYTTANEFKSLHVQLDQNNLLLYHDLRWVNGQNPYDIIWLSRIKNFWNINSVVVDESMFYMLPNAKLTAKDMLYDPYHKRFNFLGVFSFNKHLQILAQADPYSLNSGMNIGQLGIGFNVTSTIPNPQYPLIDLYANDFEMFNLALDIHSPCYPLLIAGVDQTVGGSILTETYNIANSACDILLWKKQETAHPVLKPYSLKNTLPSPNLQHNSVNLQNVVVSRNYLCDEPAACSHQYGGKSLKQPLICVHSIAEVTIESDGLFVCDGFNGDIK